MYYTYHVWLVCPFMWERTLVPLHATATHVVPNERGRGTWVIGCMYDLSQNRYNCLKSENWKQLSTVEDRQAWCSTGSTFLTCTILSWYLSTFSLAHVDYDSWRHDLIGQISGCYTMTRIPVHSSVSAKSRFWRDNKSGLSGLHQAKFLSCYKKTETCINVWATPYRSVCVCVFNFVLCVTVVVNFSGCEITVYFSTTFPDTVCESSETL